MVETIWSSAMSALGEVIMRLVAPEPGPEVAVQTMLAPTSRSLAFLVRTAPLLLKALLPVAAALTSRALRGSTPLYSSNRRSTKAAAALNLTVTRLEPPEAAAMFLA